MIAGISLVCMKVTGQQQRDTVKLDHGSWEIEAAYPGGKKALDDLFKKEMRYPLTAKKDKIEGVVEVAWTIDTLGFVRDIRIMKTVRPDLDAEAVRLAGLQERWAPFERNAKKYKTYRKQSVVFKLRKN